jgi:hypothetical protein
VLAAIAGLEEMEVATADSDGEIASYITNAVAERRDPLPVVRGTFGIVFPNAAIGFSRVSGTCCHRLQRLPWSPGSGDPRSTDGSYRRSPWRVATTRTSHRVTRYRRTHRNERASVIGRLPEQAHRRAETERRRNINVVLLIDANEWLTTG